MSKRWHQEKRRDSWGRQARSKGYRARSAYKIKQIQERFGILRPGDAVLDIGCHPGGWTQVLVEEVGEDGLVIAVDLLATSAVEGAEILIGDITERSTIDRIAEFVGERDLNAVVSDISPGLTGRYDTDQAISLELSTTALDAAMALLSPGGSFVTKVFQGAGIEGLVDSAKQRFSSVGRFSPTASRSASSETYLVCQNKRPKPLGSAADSTALEQVREHLASIGVVVEGQSEVEEGTKVGFRKLDRREG
ncbi:MAG: RlmE family RNA methyltransferase [Candidatus Thermoplasmatota archaeon]|nr:RlmE family RNA methyltransferase [Candidatus Thermoplasmatota archaeon]